MISLCSLGPAISSRPSPLDAMLPLVVIGADSYVFTVDSARGIVLDVTISIGGQVGRRHALSDLHFDDAIDQELFSQSALETRLG